MATQNHKSPADRRYVIHKVTDRATGPLLESLYLAAMEISHAITPAGPDFDRKRINELRRRAALLIDRADNDAFGRVVCPVCSETKRRTALMDHLAKCHAVQILQMPPEAFA